MKVSLIIPTYNREEYLIDTLKCAFAQSFDEYEIIVVDQTKVHSSETMLFLNENMSRMHYMQAELPSLTKARNIGVQASKGEVIIMVDDDTLFEPDFLSQHWKSYQEDFDMISGRVEEGMVKTAQHPVWFNRWGRYTGSENCLIDGLTNKFAGCNGSFKRALFDDLQGFDENFIGVANCEDADFGYRAYKAGFRIGFKSQAAIIHRKAKIGGVGNRSMKIFLDQSYYQNRLYFTRKNFHIYAYWYMKFRLHIKVIKAAFRLIKTANCNAKSTIEKRNI